MNGFTFAYKAFAKRIMEGACSAGLPENLRPARPFECAKSINRDSNVRRVMTELDESVSCVVYDGV